MGDILKDEKNTKEKEKYYRALKLRLEVLHKKRKLPICLGIITAIIFSMLFYACALDTYMYTKHNSVIIISLFMGLAMGVVMVIYAKIYLDVKESKIRRSMLDYEVENVQDKVNEDVFENSIKMSYKYLDQYYYQTREQAQKGFFCHCVYFYFWSNFNRCRYCSNVFRKSKSIVYNLYLWCCNRIYFSNFLLFIQ